MIFNDYSPISTLLCAQRRPHPLVILHLAVKHDMVQANVQIYCNLALFSRQNTHKS